MRVLLIGMGDIARKAYLPVLSRRGDLDIHLATRDEAVLDEVGRSFQIAHRHTSVIGALAVTSFDAAFVHAATLAHGELVKLLIERGVPTFVDKPLADNLGEVEALVALATQRATPLVVGFNRRYAPDYVALHGIDADLIIMEKHRYRQPDVPRRVIFDDFIHVVDTLLSLAPGPVHRRNIETHVVDGLLHTITLTLAGDVFTAIGTMHRNSGLDEECLDVIGGGARHTVLNLADRIEASGTRSLHRRADWISVGRQRGFEAMCDDFLLAARERRRVDAAAILATHEICEAIVRHTEI
ncbi:Gfo/Idh/MocA family protein [Sphingomonas xinjiangensis]|uniref:Virulence factor n=1 Tax=Sphingomonas xinjiangensis TaxID=643568 RepID=A0A840YS12_9SPHN|nr:Gfo/Idh/MocA family oxidoreductase [Sphingomonas xinjiangensis]MBB5712465.1 virulence factor [Sphingomonas xinjiangensis]